MNQIQMLSLPLISLLHLVLEWITDLLIPILWVITHLQCHLWTQIYLPTGIQEALINQNPSQTETTIIITVEQTLPVVDLLTHLPRPLLVLQEIKMKNLGREILQILTSTPVTVK